MLFFILSFINEIHIQNTSILSIFNGKIWRTGSDGPIGKSVSVNTDFRKVTPNSINYQIWEL